MGERFGSKPAEKVRLRSKERNARLAQKLLQLDPGLYRGVYEVSNSLPWEPKDGPPTRTFALIPNPNEFTQAPDAVKILFDDLGLDPKTDEVGIVAAVPIEDPKIELTIRPRNINHKKLGFTLSPDNDMHRLIAPANLPGDEPPKEGTVYLESDMPLADYAAGIRKKYRDIANSNPDLRSPSLRMTTVTRLAAEWFMKLLDARKIAGADARSSSRAPQ